MSLASLCLGILAVVLAALATAPCFGLLAAPGLLAAAIGVALGLAALAVEGRRALQRRRNGEPASFPPPPPGASAAEEYPVRHALAGILLSLVAAAWMVVMILLAKGLWL